MPRPLGRASLVPRRPVVEDPLVEYRPVLDPRVEVVGALLEAAPGVVYLADDLVVVGGLSTNEVSVVLSRRRVSLEYNYHV